MAIAMGFSGPLPPGSSAEEVGAALRGAEEDSAAVADSAGLAEARLAAEARAVAGNAARVIIIRRKDS
jgi:hypothetical protein